MMLPVIDPLVPLHPCGKLWYGSHNYSWNTALYTQAIEVALREFGQVKVVCSTIRVNSSVARSRITSTAFKMGIRVTTKLYRPRGKTPYIVGTVRPAEDLMRNYGLPQSKPTSIPVAEKPDTATDCPMCGCKEVMIITLQVEQELVKGGKGTGTYLGCPACPWASPMAVVSNSKEV